MRGRVAMSGASIERVRIRFPIFSVEVSRTAGEEDLTMLATSPPQAEATTVQTSQGVGQGYLDPQKPLTIPLNDTNERVTKNM